MKNNVTTIHTIPKDEVWANVRDGGLSHLILAAQPTSGKCAACKRK